MQGKVLPADPDDVAENARLVALDHTSGGQRAAPQAVVGGGDVRGAEIGIVGQIDVEGPGADLADDVVEFWVVEGKGAAFLAGKGFTGIVGHLIHCVTSTVLLPIQVFGDSLS